MTTLLTIKETGEYLRVHRTTVYHWLAHDPSFPQPVKVGKRLRIRLEDLEAWTERDRNGS